MTVTVDLTVVKSYVYVDLDETFIMISYFLNLDNQFLSNSKLKVSVKLNRDLGIFNY